jgi:RecJ OB domain
MSRNVEVADVKEIGEDGAHLRLRLRDGRVTWPAIAFGMGERDVQTEQRVDVVYSFCADRGNNGGLELRVRDIAPTVATTFN